MASLKERIQADLTVAMRARDEVVRSMLRLVLTGISRAEAAGKQHVTLTDDQVLAVIRSEIAKRDEAAHMYAAAGRGELERKERAEAAVLAPYLPPEVGADVLDEIVAEEIARAEMAGIEGPKAMGIVIKAVRERVGNQAGGGRIADAVKAAISGPGPAPGGGVSLR